MHWRHVLFLHWPVAGDRLQPLLPAGLQIDRYEGQAWIGVIPFTMRGVRPAALPPLPGCSAFHELNVRTYVRPVVGPARDRQPGVYFFSLDAANPLAVVVARRVYLLNYLRARMSLRLVANAVDYQSRRVHRGAPPAELACRYVPTGPTAPAEPGSLDAFLVERYCLYTADRRGAVLRVRIRHRPWLLQPAHVEIQRNTMAEGLGIELAARPERARYAARLAVVASLPRQIGQVPQRRDPQAQGAPVAPPVADSPLAV